MSSFITIIMLCLLLNLDNFTFTFTCAFFQCPQAVKKSQKPLDPRQTYLDLCHRLKVKPSGVLQIMSTSLTFPPHMIGRSALKMLKEWVHQGGTRERLLEVAQAFRFNNAAVKIAEGNAFSQLHNFSYTLTGVGLPD